MRAIATTIIAAKTIASLSVALLLLPAVAHAQAAAPPLAATIGPRGELSELRAGNTVYISNAAVAIVKPGWSGDVVNQRTLDPSTVGVMHMGRDTGYSGVLTGAGVRVRMTELVHVTPGAVSIQWTLIPLQDVACECVLVQALLPADVHAGRTRWVVGDFDGLRGVLPAALDADRYILMGGRPAAWLGFERPGGPALRVASHDMVFQLQDDRKWGTPGFGLLAMAGNGMLKAMRPFQFELLFQADKQQQMETDARALAGNDLRSLKQRDDSPLKVRASADRQTVETYGAIEIDADVAAHYDNPFDPEQIAVDAEIRTPAGRTIAVPGFFYVPMWPESLLGYERVQVAGRSSFHVRYTPTAPGRYSLVVKATDRTGTVRSAPIRFTATATRSPGFVRVSRVSPNYFMFDGGKPFFAIGENICWAGGRTPLADYEQWLEGLGRAGGNWARLWMAFNEKGLEWMPSPTPKPGIGAYMGLGRYAQDNAWRLDRIVRQAHEYGVRVMLCLGTYGEFTEGGYFGEGSWASNPYNAANGGPCAHAADFWTNALARKLYKRRLRYLVARWGFSTDIFGWEFWNEVPPSPAETAWVAEMAAYLKSIDPNRHLVSTTYGSPALWRCPDVDFTMDHRYGEAGKTADFTGSIADDAHVARLYRKPYLLAEFGIDWQTGDTKWDPKGVGTSMHNGAWAAMMSGAAGTSMLWYWDGYVDPLNMYGVLTPVRQFAETVDWAKSQLAPVGGIRLEGAPGEPEAFTDVFVPATVEWGATPSSRYVLKRDGTVEGGPIAMTIGSPQRGRPGELPTALTWVLDMPAEGRVTLNLGNVSSHAHLVVSLDGRPVIDRELPAGEPGKGPWKRSVYLSQYRLWQSDYDEEIPVDVPPGPHELTVANTGGDWLQIRSIAVPAYRSSRYPNVDALGLRGGRLLLLWLHNRESTWRADFDGKRPSEVRGLRVAAPAAEGAWKVDWWDTWTGSVLRRDTIRAEGGQLQLRPPAFARDLAARCELH